MDDKGRVALTALIGAVIGGLWGYLYLTESGRRLRVQIEPTLDSFVKEVRQARGTVQKARAAVDESWRSINELAGGSGPMWDKSASRTSH
ncbi:MAG: YtxH domain-containing protein [Acidobacteria bacterium]|nr:YtxH domain-containing protein [Acidobacteriota bacterium]